MDRRRIEREKDREVLRRVALMLETETRLLYRKLALVRSELARAKGEDQAQIELIVRHLQEQLGARNAELFGSSQSERRGRPDGQGDGEAGGEQEGGQPQAGQAGEAAPEPEKPAQRGHGPRPQPKLPVQEQIFKLPPEELICPFGCGPLEEKPSLAVQTEKVTVEIRTFHILVETQKVYGCDECDYLTMAPKPESFLPGGRYTEQFAALAAVEKFSDHIPLERQVKRMRRAGLEVTGQTLWDQELRLATLLAPTYESLHDWMLDSHDVLGADETRWRMMEKKAPSKLWWAWGLSAPDGLFFDLLPSRGREAAMLVLKGFAGILVADGLSTYACLEKAASKGGVQLPIDGEQPPRLPDFLLACCWAHARRYFIKAEKNNPVANEILDLIAALYAVEGKAARLAVTEADLLEKRRELRTTESRAITAKIHTWLLAQRPIPGLQLDDAIQYALNRWSALTLFLDHPEVPLDNNFTEQGMRGLVLGRLNFQGVRSARGARVAAIFYSLIGTCQRQGIEPWAYLVFAARRAIDKPGTVTLPHEYKRLMAEAGQA